MRTPSPQPNLDASGDFGWRFWLLVPATGLAAGLGAGLLMRLLAAVQYLAWGEDAETFLTAVQKTSYPVRVAVVAGGGLVVAVGLRLLRRLPGAGGDLSVAIWFKAGRLPFLRSLAQGVLSIVIVGLGASLGREQAPKQAGAAFGSLFATRCGLTPSHRRILAAFGAGAGIAAVYEVPLGGALFAIEVLLGSLALPLIAPAVAATAVATAASWLLLPMEPVYPVPFDATTASLCGFAIVAGPLLGLAAAAYVRLIARADAWRPASAIQGFLAPVVVFTALGLLAIPLPQVLGNGKNAVELAFTGMLTWPILAALVVMKPLATAACLGSKAPGGMFTPTVTYGAVLGGLLGCGWALLWPGAAPGPCAMIGAAAVLAGTTQGPVSAVVLVLELTKRLDTLMVPVLLAVAGAMLVVRFVEPRSIYAYRISDSLDAAGSKEAAISMAARYIDLLRALPTQGGALVAVDEAGHAVGRIDAARARHPRPGDGPLLTASAGDFILDASAAGGSTSDPPRRPDREGDRRGGPGRDSVVPATEP